MKNNSKPIIIAKKHLEKISKRTNSNRFDEVLSPDILKDICKRITGEDEYISEFVENDYSDDYFTKGPDSGRMIVLKYNGTTHFITCSPQYIDGSNYAVQSVPTTINTYFKCKSENKKLHYYFLMIDADGTRSPLSPHIATAYRMMSTIGVNFINMDYLKEHMRIRKMNKRKTRGETDVDHFEPFVTIGDLINARNNNSKGNKGNKPTYLTKNTDGDIEIYVKTYGANKYDSVFFCYSLAELIKNSDANVIVYEMVDGKDNKLEKLPGPSRKIIEANKKITIITTNNELENSIFDQDNKKGESFRSPRYNLNLLEKLGEKKCAFCGCEIPEIIQGAHIWPVGRIKEAGYLKIEQKRQHAISGENGIWLCQNHHGLFDNGIITIDHSGRIIICDDQANKNKEFVNNITTYKNIPEKIMTAQFVKYLDLRNQKIESCL